MRNTPLLPIVAVLWAYSVSNYLFRIWYVATAAALLVAALLIGRRVARVSGLGRAIAPVIAYFAVLLAGVLWAMYPADTLRWVAIDSIGIAVFVLAFLAGRNASPAAIADGLMTLTIPAVIMTAIMVTVEPEAPRIAQYAVALLPFVAPFAYWRAVTARTPWPAVLTLAATFAVLIIGRSRTHLATAVLLTILAALAFRKNTRQALMVITAVAVTGMVLVLVPATRAPIAEMSMRLAGEPVNPQRVALAAVSKSLWQETMPLGIGYGNFIRRFQAVTGYELQVHSVYAAWLVEGGILGIAAVLFLAGSHIRALAAYIREAPSPDQRAYGQVCAIASIGIATIGVFHQVHQTPALWMILGIGAACGAEARSRRAAVTPDVTPLLDAWRRSNPPFAPPLCEPLMATAFRYLSQCEPGAMIVDVGCGTGFMVRALSEGGYRAFGVDADPSVLGRRSIAGDGERLPLQSGGADAIFVFSAFQYMNRASALEECRRVLKPGGRFVVIENLAGNPVAMFSRMVRHLRGLGYPRYLEPREHLRWSERSIYERYFSDVTYEVHHVLSPLFLISRALDFPFFVRALRIMQAMERWVLNGGWCRGAAWHVVITGRK